MEKIKTDQILPIVRLALREDIGIGDITTDSLIPEELEATAEIIVEEECVVAGLPVAKVVFEEIDNQIEFAPEVSDGDRVPAAKVIARVKGLVRGILTGERLALNFLQRLSGIATLTAEFVEAVREHSAKILDTRKTTPGLRYLEKYAVRIGGGANHRMGLYDRFLIKDNHIFICSRSDGYRTIRQLVETTRKYNPNISVEVEAETLDQARMAIEAGADIIMLDNMSPHEMKKAVDIIAGRAVTEASGGITLDNIAEIAATGVDCISVGSLTSAARNINIKMELT